VNEDDIRELVKERRKEYRLTLQELADECECSRGMLCKFETGKSGVGLNLLLKIFTVLNITVQ